jgi:hypothetical protein
MEKLTEPQRENVKTMSDIRLVSMLTRAGYTSERSEEMDRTAKMAAVAEIIASRETAEMAVVEAPAFGYDPELKRLKFERMKQKWEDERRRQEKREAAEKLEREVERKRLEEKEKYDREYERIMLEIRQAELEDRRRREKGEDIEKKSATIMAKRCGDAMRSSMFRMGKDPIDLIASFEHIEELFRVYEVPDDIKVQLMRTFLNERASILLSRLDVAKARSYPAVKDYLIRQFKLTPRLYLNRFNNMQCQLDEICVSFCSRLKMLLQYYLNSRNVKTFEGLFAFCLLVIVLKVYYLRMYSNMYYQLKQTNLTVG